MTTYLTKNVNGQVHHFRALVEETGVVIVQGVFYNWLDTHYHNYENVETAKAAQMKLVAEKLDDGFELTEFEATGENSTNVYDKAQWHYNADFPKDIDPFQGYVHTGMFFGWLIDKGLVSDTFKNDFGSEIKAFQQRRYTGAQLYKTCCDGILMIEDLNEEGNRFALDYFHLDWGEYLADYEETLGQNIPTIYHVADTWDNYQTLKAVIDRRYEDWLKTA